MQKTHNYGLKPGTCQARALDLLRKHPQGLVSDEVARSMGGRQANWSEALRHVVLSGAACWVLDPKGKSAHRKRFFAAEFAEQAAEFKRQRELKAKPKKKSETYGLRLDSGAAAVTPRGVRVTVGPAFDPEKRFLPSDGNFAPLFSCLAPGRYLECDTWVARAYGGGR